MSKLYSSRYRISSFSDSPYDDIDIHIPDYESDDYEDSEDVALRGVAKFDHQPLVLSPWDLEYFGQWKLADNSKQVCYSLEKLVEFVSRFLISGTITEKAFFLMTLRAER